MLELYPVGKLSQAQKPVHSHLGATYEYVLVHTPLAHVSVFALQLDVVTVQSAFVESAHMQNPQIRKIFFIVFISWVKKNNHQNIGGQEVGNNYLVTVPRILHISQALLTRSGVYLSSGY
ncbi:MAG: hypothetical protein LBF28_03420 [Rickettsiales bacterium]|nr:hypothetical protein [Rickettsiales bacterium]